MGRETINFCLKILPLALVFISFDVLLYKRVFIKHPKAQGTKTLSLSPETKNHIEQPCHNLNNSNDVETFYDCVLTRLKQRKNFPNDRGFWHVENLIETTMIERGILMNASIETIPNEMFLEVGIWDPGHGLNNVRTMYVLALVWCKFLNRTLVLPDFIPKGPVKLNDLVINSSSYQVPITDIFDVDEMNRIGYPDYKIIKRSQLPPYLVDANVPPFGPETISGSNWRSSNFIWYEEDVIRFLNHYEGIYLKVPYYFCDGRSPLFNDERKKANRLLVFSKPILSNVQKILDSIATESNNKKLVSIHPRTAAIYGGKDSSNWNSLANEVKFRYPPDQYAVYVASDYSSYISTFLQDYSVFDKEKLLGKLEHDKDTIPFKISAIDFEVCRRSQIFLGGALGSSFDSMVLHLREDKDSLSFVSWEEICPSSFRLIDCFYLC